MQYLEQLLGIELGQPARLLIAFFAVMILIALTAAVIRGIAGMRSSEGSKRGNRRQRLGIGEWVQVDDKRRLVLVRRDNVEHLLLIGGNSDVVVEHDTGNLKGPATAPVIAATAVTPPPPDVLEPPEEPRPPAIDLAYRSPLRIERPENGAPGRVEPEMPQQGPRAAGPAKGIGTRLQRDMNAAGSAPTAKPAPASGKPAANAGGEEIESAASQAIAEALDLEPAPSRPARPKTPARAKTQDDDLEEALMKELESGD